ncbi:hypothetical protein Hanom_Chr04g00370041 [Helianthus anomalus]
MVVVFVVFQFCSAGSKIRDVFGSDSSYVREPGFISGRLKRVVQIMGSGFGTIAAHVFLSILLIPRLVGFV